MADPQPHERARWRAGMVSLVVAVALLAVKFYAWTLTGSSAVLSDALESIVNVVAAAFALGSIVYAGLPADRNHPFGHGKIEFFAAVFEGGLIAFAAAMILYEAGRGLYYGVELRELDTGAMLVLAAGLGNCALGIYLLRVGRRAGSPALIADGHHVLSDFYTSLGVVGGLVAVRLSGLQWLDPLAAVVVAFVLLITGWKLVRHAAGGLLDEEDPALLQRIVGSLSPRLSEGVIRVHHLRAIRAGRYHHVSAHLVVPEFWTVDRAHALAERLSALTIRELGIEGELTFHTDPCERAWCGSCDLEHCSVRRAAFAGRRPLTVEEAVRPDEMPGVHTN